MRGRDRSQQDDREDQGGDAQVRRFGLAAVGRPLDQVAVGATGQRVMSLKLDARGRPVGRPMEVLGGWDAVAGVRPKGAPTGLAVDRAGRLWVVEDRNKTVLMVRTE